MYLFKIKVPIGFLSTFKSPIKICLFYFNNANKIIFLNFTSYFQQKDLSTFEDLSALYLFVTLVEHMDTSL